jgi:hypothetical protein
VDAANEPAIAMYSRAGFWAWEERAIWVKDLTREDSASNVRET